MTFGAIVFVAFAGFLVATLVFVILVRWVALVYGAYQQAEILEPANPVPRAIVTGLCQSLFHEAPWAILTVGFVAGHIHSEPWAPWLFGGFAVGFGYMVLIVAVAGLRLRKQMKERAAQAA
jgi:hypothetical protein